jgi:glycosyltransferase involved in cell wall biosynthesis
VHHRYVIVTPVRDEAAHLAVTADSLVAQTITPAQWVVVDDGSTDGTGDIARRSAAQHPWVTVVERADRGFRAPGGGVMEAFHDGFAAVTVTDWDFLVKLDGDVLLEPDYFEQCLARFDANPRLGIGGGAFHNPVGAGSDEYAEERTPVFHVRGATKIYRRACWDAIGGLIRTTGWDTYDEVKANRLGWETYTFRDLVVRQQRTTGGVAGPWQNAVKNGKAAHIVGYDPVFMLARAARSLARPHGLKIGAGLLRGYFGAVFERAPRVDDPETIRYIRREQRNRLLGRESIWR